MKPIARRAFLSLSLLAGLGVSLGVAGCGGGSSNLPSPDGGLAPAPSASELSGRIVYLQTEPVTPDPQNDAIIPRTSVGVIGANGSGQKRLTPADTTARNVAVSLDGARAVSEFQFGTVAGDVPSGLYFVNTDGSGLRRFGPANTAYDIALSPDGNRFAYSDRYVRKDTGQFLSYIFVASTSGNFSPRQLQGIGETPFAFAPTFSPDGKSLAFAANDPAGTGTQIYTMPVDNSSAPRRVTSSASFKVSPSFSADGRSIAFLSGDQIYVVNSDGTNERRLASEPGRKRTLTFSPDGRFVAYDVGDFNETYSPRGTFVPPEIVRIYITRADRPSGSLLLQTGAQINRQYAPSWGR